MQDILLFSIYGDEKLLENVDVMGDDPVIFDRVHYMKRFVKYVHFLCTESSQN